MTLVVLELPHAVATGGGEPELKGQVGLRQGRFPARLPETGEIHWTFCVRIAVKSTLGAPGSSKSCSFLRNGTAGARA